MSNQTSNRPRPIDFSHQFALALARLPEEIRMLRMAGRLTNRVCVGVHDLVIQDGAVGHYDIPVTTRPAVPVCFVRQDGNYWAFDGVADVSSDPELVAVEVQGIHDAIRRLAPALVGRALRGDARTDCVPPQFGMHVALCPECDLPVIGHEEHGQTPDEARLRNSQCHCGEKPVTMCTLNPPRVVFRCSKGHPNY